MTAPRIIPAAEAAEIRQVSDDAIAIMVATDASDTNLRAAALVRDLAATVVALHAEVERLRSDDYAQARRIADAAISCERARILALLTERADATREHDGRESVVSASYRLAASLIVAKVTP